MKYILLLLALFISACSSTPKQAEVNEPQVTESDMEKQSIYFFEHRLLPKWTFTSEGRLYDDLVLGNLETFKQAASEIVTPEFADQLTIKPVENESAILITFPQPRQLTHCFYVLILKTGDTFAYYTYEKTMSFGEQDGVKGVVGMWSEDGAHSNLGPRNYTSAEDFISDILN